MNTDKLSEGMKSEEQDWGFISSCLYKLDCLGIPAQLYTDGNSAILKIDKSTLKDMLWILEDSNFD